MLRSAVFPFLRPPLLARSYANKFSKNTKTEKKIIQKVLFDEDIKPATVQLTDPESGVLRHPQPIKALLASIDRSVYRVQLVKKNENSSIVKLVSKIALTQHQMNLKAQARAQARSIAANAVKEVQISVDVSLKDLEHKLDKVEEILREGRRVDLVLTRRSSKYKRPGDPTEEMLERTGILVEKFVDSGLATEYKDREVRPHMVVMFLRGKAKNANVSAESLSESRKTSIHKLYWNGNPSETDEKLEKVKSDLVKGVFVELALAKRAERKNMPPAGSVPPPIPQPPPPLAAEEKQQQLEENEEHQVAMRKTVESIVARLSDISSEWQDREVKSTKTTLFLQPLSNTAIVEWLQKANKTKAKAMVHKGPKRKKAAYLVDDLYQD